MQVELWPINKVLPYEGNPRRNDGAAAKLVDIIKEFGFKIPLLVKPDGEIISGHTRLKAAKILKLKEIPVIVCADLSDAQAKALRLADNKSAEWAEWDLGKLICEFDELKNIDFDLDLTGFDVEERKFEKAKLAEKEDILKPFQWVRILISIPINEAFEAEKIIEEIKKIPGAEIDFGNN